MSAVSLLCSALGDGSHTPAVDRVDPATRARDAAWLVHIQAGDARAFEALFRAYVDPLTRFARSYLDDGELARELVADVFAAVWERHAAWAPEHGVAVYLYGAIHNRALNAQRARRRQRRWADTFAAADAVPGHGVPAEAADAGVLRADVAERVWRAIDALPEPRRQAVVLRWHHGLSASEIAVILGTSTDAVYQLLKRSHDVLRRLLGPELG